MPPIIPHAASRRGRSFVRLFGLLALTGGAAAQAATAPPEAAKARLAEQYGHMPLAFEANQGQTDAQVRFLARGAGYGLFLTADEAVLSLRPGSAAPRRPGALARMETEGGPSAGSAHDRDATRARNAVIRARLLGANPNPRVGGEELQPGRSTYLIGNDPAKWTTNVERYGKVRYEGVYPGIDLVYYGNGQQALEYDFVVAPKADPGRIRLHYEGVEAAKLTKAGDLELKVAGGAVTLHKPVIYQSAGLQRRPVSGRYVVECKGEAVNVAFALGRYDRSQAVVIDPVLVYSTYLGGSSYDDGAGIAIDSAGQAYVTGNTASADFPTQDPLQPALSSTDAYVAKLATDGRSLVYSTYLGGSGGEAGKGIAVDAAGQAHVVGVTSSTDFPTHLPLQAALKGDVDVFVAKLAADGQSLLYSSYLGGSTDDEAAGIALDNGGRAYVTGTTDSTDFPIKSALQPTQADSGIFDDAFVAKIAADGHLIYSTFLGGGDYDFGLAIAADDAGQAYVTGSTSSGDFPTHLPLQPTFGGGRSDAFVAKLAADGRSLVYATYLGGSDDEFGSTGDVGTGIAVDGAGQAYVIGHTQSTDFPTRSPLQAVKANNFDVFVVKLAVDGRSLVYGTYLGGNSVDLGGDIAVDTAGQAYVTGHTESTDFPTRNPLQSGLAGGDDVFVAKLAADGKSLSFSTYLGGSGIDRSSGIAVGDAGRIYVVGTTDSTNFPTQLPLQAANAGGSDAFVAKINPTSSSAGQLRFSAATYTIAEGQGQAVIRVQRSGGSSGAVSISYATSPGTATAGSDYQARSGTLSWASGDASTKSFSIPIVNDTKKESSETVRLTLSSPTGGSSLGSPSSATLTITDND